MQRAERRGQKAERGAKGKGQKSGQRAEKIEINNQNIFESRSNAGFFIAVKK